jgi:hypothetical protein
MRKVTVSTFASVDGVMQARGGPAEIRPVDSSWGVEPLGRPPPSQTPPPSLSHRSAGAGGKQPPG